MPDWNDWKEFFKWLKDNTTCIVIFVILWIITTTIVLIFTYK